MVYFNLLLARSQLYLIRTFEFIDTMQTGVCKINDRVFRFSKVSQVKVHEMLRKAEPHVCRKLRISRLKQKSNFFI